MNFELRRWASGAHEDRVGLVRILKEHQGCSLSAAKAMMEVLVDDGRLSVSIPEHEAPRFEAAVRALGIEVTRL